MTANGRFVVAVGDDVVRILAGIGGVVGGRAFGFVVGEHVTLILRYRAIGRAFRTRSGACCCILRNACAAPVEGIVMARGFARCLSACAISQIAGLRSVARRARIERANGLHARLVSGNVAMFGRHSAAR